MTSCQAISKNPYLTTRYQDSVAIQHVSKLQDQVTVARSLQSHRRSSSSLEPRSIQWNFTSGLPCDIWSSYIFTIAGIVTTARLELPRQYNVWSHFYTSCPVSPGYLEEADKKYKVSTLKLQLNPTIGCLSPEDNGVFVIFSPWWCRATYIFKPARGQLDRSPYKQPGIGSSSRWERF